MRARGDLKQAGFIAAGKILAMLLSFTVPLFLTRFLSKSDYGLYSQFYTITTFFGAVFSMGIASSLYYFYPTTEEANKSKLIGNVYILLLMLGVFGSLLTMTPSLNQLFLGKDEIIDYAQVISICILFSVPSSMINTVYVVRQDTRTTILYPSFEVIIKALVVITAALLGGSLDSIFYSLVLLQLVIFLFVTAYSFMNRKFKLVIPTDRTLLKNQLNYSLPFGMAVILNALTRRFDKIICISYLSVTDYAIYAVAFFGIPGIQEIYDSLSQINVIHMTKEFKDGNNQEVLQSYKNFIVKTLSFSTPIISIVFLFSNEIIGFLFTETYLEAVPFFRIYILSFVIGMFGAGTILRASGKTKLSFKAYLYSAVFSLPITFLLIKEYGSYGAISSAMFAMILPKIVQSYYEIRLLNCSVRDYFPWKKIGIILVITLLCLIPFIAIHQWFNLNVFFSALCAFLYLLITFSSMIILDVFTIDKNYILSKLPFFIFKR